tara:strand:+ start:102 stop:665 length:564 start_codon:yes stop_codon:yes gene_type:complete
MSDTEFNDNLSENDVDTDVESISDIGSDDDVNDENIDVNDEIIKDLSTGAQGEMEHIDDDDDDDDYDEVYNKIERASDIIHGNNNTISRDKMLPLLIVKRNKNNVIVDDNHKTIPLLTKYEKTKIIGLRAVQLANGLKPFIEVPEDVIEPTVIADMELKQKKIPFILKRPVSLTRFEYWPINELEII